MGARSIAAVYLAERGNAVALRDELGLLHAGLSLVLTELLKRILKVASASHLTILHYFS
jgi:hypothetical protein